MSLPRRFLARPDSGRGAGIRHRCQAFFLALRRISFRSWAVISVSCPADRRRSVFLGDVPFLHHPAGPAGEQDHALAEPDGFADVVGDEDDRAAGFPPDPLELLVQESRVIASSAANGSSISRIWRSWASARARATRWRMPPDSSCGRFPPARPGARASRSSSACRGARLADAAQLQRQLDVLPRGQPGKERGVLEHEGGAVAGHSGCPTSGPPAPR